MSRVNTTFQITRGREITRVWVFYYYFLISYPISQKRLYKLEEKKKAPTQKLGWQLFAAMRRFERLNNSEGRQLRKEVTLLLCFSLTWELHSLVTCPEPWWSPSCVSTDGGRVVASPPATRPAKSWNHPRTDVLLARHAAPRPPVQELPKRRGEIKSCSLLCFLHTREGKHSLIFIPLKKAACVGLHTASQMGWAGTDIFLPIEHSHL